MATFSGSAAGYNVGFMADGRIRVKDIDASDGDTGDHFVAGAGALTFDDRTYEFDTRADVRVNTSLSGSHDYSAIATLPDGDYLVSWAQYIPNELSDVFIQRYDAAGNAVGGQIRVNTVELDFPAKSDMAVLEGGGFVVTWLAYPIDYSVDSGIYAQCYDAAGNKVGGETFVGDTVENQPAVAALAGGGYVIFWQDYEDVYTQRYDAAGNKVGVTKHVSTTNNYNIWTEVKGVADGGYIVLWEGYARRYDAAGNAVGPATTSDSTHFRQPLADGGYLVLSRAQEGDDWAVFARRYDAADNVVGDDLRVGTALEGWSGFEVTELQDGGFVFAWASYGDGYSHISTQRFDANGASVPTGLVLRGTNAADAMNGGVGAQKLIGLGGDDILNGRNGDDLLEGGAGNDSLFGGWGDDVLVGGGEYYGGDNFLDGGGGDDFLTAGDGSDTLRGDVGDDRLEGGYGNDVLEGGHGNDILDGGYDNDTLTGGRGADILYGGDYGNDTLAGGAGSDVLDGGYFDDTLTGGRGADVFRFSKFAQYSGGVDTITDFSRADDLIELENAAFTKLAATGTLHANRFAANVNGVAMDGDDNILYETDTGALYYDADGNGAGAKVQIALIGISTHPTLTAADFVVI